MRKQVRRGSVLLAAVALALVAAWPAAARDGRGSGASTGRNCVNHLEHLNSYSAEAIVVSSICFDTFAQAFRHMTRGRVAVPDNLRPDQVTDAMVAPLSADSVVVLSTDWGGDNYHDGGFFDMSSVNWEASSSCTTTQSWALSSVGNRYDNLISSSKTYGNCHKGQHYENTNYGGARLTCQPNCATMGIMNNQTSSLSWDW